MFCFKTKNIYKETINKSKFICLNFNISGAEQAKEIIKKLHSEYPDASHICYAYILGNNQEEFFYSDDGEPSKTAGFPIYTMMQKYKLSFCLIAVVRYFGGIKFGVSTLKDSFAALAEKLIKLNQLSNVKKVGLYELKFGYDKIKIYENKFKNEIIKKEFSDDVVFHVICNENNKKLLEQNDAKLINSDYLLIDKN